MHILGWLGEDNVKCFLIQTDKSIMSFALLHKCDFDPLKTHTNPHVLDFVYTFPEYRRNGLAHKLLLHVKETNNITAFCNNDKSELLFKKAGYILTNYDVPCNLPTFRYP